ncbi:MAG TPA: AAA family ATPase [Crinalium sp.]
MDSREIKKEANLLFNALSPLLKLGNGYADFILIDLARIIRLCSQSNQTISANELLAYLIVYALIRQDADKLNAAIHLWDKSAEERIKYQKEILKILLELTDGKNPDESLILPSLLNKYDEANGTNFLTKTVNAIYQFAQVITKADGSITLQEMESLSSVWRLLHSYQKYESYDQALAAASQYQSTETSPAAPPEPVGKALDDLNDLVGMENIKEEVRSLTNFLKVQKVRSERGLAKTSVSLHSVFCGPPGTGKTTVARLMGTIFRDLGFLAKGHLVETDRAGMVAGYVGQTSKKVDELVKSALDGVLFIDEAYALEVPNSANDFGQEAIDTLLKRMEDYRDRLVVIVAGYTDEMSIFIESNPGLKSRFNRYFYFNDYIPDELVAIFEKLCEKSHFKLTPDAKTVLHDVLYRYYSNRDRTFGNARLVRNLFEKTIERQANRLAVLSSLTDELLITIRPEDIPTAESGDRSPFPRQ